MKALIIIDMQNDFMDDGALPVPGAKNLVPLINQLMKSFNIVIASMDWHPDNHVSFFSQHEGKKVRDVINWHGISQTLWPRHCVQNTKGAELVSGLDKTKIAHIVYKGIDQNIDSYSAFFDNAHQRATGLHDILKSHNIDELYICGVLTELCVKFTALDACELGYKVYLIKDGCLGVNLSPKDSEKALVEMQKAGVYII